MLCRHLTAPAAVLTGLAILVAAVIATNTASTAASGVPMREVVVTRSGVSLPTGCSPQTIAALVDRFFAAFDDGRWDEIDSLFSAAGPAPADFKLFSWQRDVVQERDRLVARSRRAIQSARSPRNEGGTRFHVGRDHVRVREAGRARRREGIA